MCGLVSQLQNCQNSILSNKKKKQAKKMPQAKQKTMSRKKEEEAWLQSCKACAQSNENANWKKVSYDV